MREERKERNVEDEESGGGVAVFSLQQSPHHSTEEYLYLNRWYVCMAICTDDDQLLLQARL